MSHARGEVWTLNGVLLGYFEYNGTVDVAYTAIQSSREELDKHWRDKGNWRECKCDSIKIPVLLYTDYGFGYYWDGEVCVNCLTITDGTGVYDIKTKDGYPFPKLRKGVSSS